MEAIEIENIGPIERLNIPVPEGGGVVVLRGPNGIGKTKALDAVDALTSGDGSLARRDGSLASGKVAGFGAIIKVAQRTSRAGDLEVIRLEDQTCIADLVDPKMKDAAASDRKRLKALLTMLHAEIDLAKFHELVGGKDQFDAVVKPSSLDAGDAVEVAALIKRDFEGASREAEKKRNTASDRAAGLAVSFESVDLQGPHDAEQLREANEQAATVVRDLKATAKAVNDANQGIETAREHIKAAKAEYVGPTVESAERDFAIVDHELTEVLKQIASLTEQRLVLEVKHKGVIHSVRTAKGHVEQLEGLNKIIDAAIGDTPSQAKIDAADAKANDAASAMEQGGVIREALKQKTEHDDYKLAAKQHDVNAAEYRDAAMSVDAVLSELVNDDRITVIDGRLAAMKGDQQVYLHDLSPGERWSIAMDIAISVIGEGGVMVIPQEAWEGLDPNNRALVAGKAHGRNVTVLTAEPSGGDLRAEEYTDDN